MRPLLPAALILLALSAPAGAIPEPRDGRSGLPTPRFGSLRSGEVNMRAGPGAQYPVTWFYQRRGLPVEVLREWGPWRLVRDPDGATGWIDGVMVSVARTGLVTRAVRTLHDRPDAAGRAVARVEPGTVARVLMCAGDWCRVQIDARAGWIARSELWGIGPGETIG